MTESGVSTRLAAMLWWLALPLFPLLWLQGIYARSRTPRLPEASGAPTGVIGEGARQLHLLVIGESPVAGVGVDCYEDALPAQIAKSLAQMRGEQVRWIALGSNGADVRQVCSTAQRMQHHGADVVLAVLGVNDTAGLTSRRRWRAGLLALTHSVRVRLRCPIVFAPVPPLSAFTALPQPLRAVMGLRSRLLDRDLERVVAGLPAVTRADALPLFEPRYLARDGYHPSAEGCRLWGAALAERVNAALNAPIQRT